MEIDRKSDFEKPDFEKPDFESDDSSAKLSGAFVSEIPSYRNDFQCPFISMLCNNCLHNDTF